MKSGLLLSKSLGLNLLRLLGNPVLHPLPESVGKIRGGWGRTKWSSQRTSEPTKVLCITGSGGTEGIWPLKQEGHSLEKFENRSPIRSKPTFQVRLRKRK